MNLFERVKNILLSPKDEWPKIAGETTDLAALYTGYIMILAAIGPIALVIRSLSFGATAAIVLYVLALALCYVMALIVDALAPTFGGEKNFIQSLKLMAYSYTAAWVAGIFQLLGMLGGLIGLIAGIYSLYTFYLGVPVMKKCPQEKAVAYTVVVVLCGIVLAVLVGVVMRMTLFGGVMPM